MNVQKTITCSRSFFLGLLGLTLFASPVAAQVFDLGPSDSAFFDTVINVPTDPNIGDAQSVGGGDLLIQLNISDGGNVGNDFSANDGSEINISGGDIGRRFWACSGSEVNMSGGNLNGGFIAREGSVVNISGGDQGQGSTAGDGSEVNVSGGNLGFFSANGGSVVDISGGIVGGGVSVSTGSVVKISGGYIGRSYSNPGGDLELIGGEFQLNGVPFSAPTFSLNQGDIFTGTFADGSAFIFADERGDFLSGVQLTSVALPALDLSPIVVSTSNPNRPFGLRSGQTLRLLAGGELEFMEMTNATLNVEGGAVGTGAIANNSTVNVSDGSVGGFFKAISSVLNINGGLVGDRSDVISSVVNITDGDLGHEFVARSGSEVNISGGNVGRQFEALSSVVNISGGRVSSLRSGSINEEGTGSVVNMSGGSIAGFSARSDSEINISGGIVGFGARVSLDTVVNISGGLIDHNFSSSGEVNISGGELVGGIDFRGSIMNISGGNLGPDFDLFGGSEVNLSGSNFALDGEPLDSLTIDDAFTIVDRDVTLTGLLADGSPFGFNLNSILTFGTNEDFFSPDATVSVTLVSPVVSTLPETILGDVNQDGEANLFDIFPIIGIVTTGVSLDQADCNQDGEVNLFDIAPFIEILTGS